VLEQACATKADLIVLTTHGRSGVRRAVLGSVADRVARHATMPVLVVPPPRSQLPVGAEADGAATAAW
jgi:nucleotide-binding universal stress UspA family protein